MEYIVAKSKYVENMLTYDKNNNTYNYYNSKSGYKKDYKLIWSVEANSDLFDYRHSDKYEQEKLSLGYYEMEEKLNALSKGVWKKYSDACQKIIRL